MARRRDDDEYDDDPRDDRNDRDYDDEPRGRPARRRRNFECPYCGSTELPVKKNQISVGGWIVFAVMIFVCLPLFWIGLLMKEEVETCYDCGRKIGG